MTFVCFRFSAKMNVRFHFVSFLVVNGISFSLTLSFMAKNEKCFRSTSIIHHKKVLRCKVLVLVLNTRPPSDPPSNAPWFFNRLRRYISFVLTYLLTYKAWPSSRSWKNFKVLVLILKLTSWSWLDLGLEKSLDYITGLIAKFTMGMCATTLPVGGWYKNNHIKFGILEP